MSRGSKALWLLEQKIHFTALFVRRGSPFLITFNQIWMPEKHERPSKTKIILEIIMKFICWGVISSCEVQERTVSRKKSIIRKHRHRFSMEGKYVLLIFHTLWIKLSQSRTNAMYICFYKLVHKACQQQTRRSPGACLTQWDCKLELRRMQQFKGTQMTSAVLGNGE